MAYHLLPLRYADRRRPGAGWRRPGIENSAQLAVKTIEVGQLPLKERPDMHTRPRLCAPKRNDAPDLREGQPKPTSLRHEVQQVEDVSRIDAIPRGCAALFWEDPARLIQTERLAAEPALGRYLSDQQAVSRHERRIDPAS
jgi:hypothetical protein